MESGESTVFGVLVLSLAIGPKYLKEHQFLPLFINYLLSIYSMPGAILGIQLKKKTEYGAHIPSQFLINITFYLPELLYGSNEV